MTRTHALHADPARARAVGKRHAQLRPLVQAYERWVALGEDEQAARAMADLQELTGMLRQWREETSDLHATPAGQAGQG